MLKELLEQIGEVVEGDGAGKSGKDPSVNIIIGNSGTVVIGDGSKGSTSGDRDQDSSDDSQASMQGMMREIEKLRAQIRQLMKAVRKLFLKSGDDGFKDWREAKRGRLKTEGTKCKIGFSVSNRPPLNAPPLNSAIDRVPPAPHCLHAFSKNLESVSIFDRADTLFHRASERGSEAQGRLNGSLNWPPARMIRPARCGRQPLSAFACNDALRPASLGLLAL